MAGETQVTTDHKKIRQWADERGGEPATVKGTGAEGKPGVLRIHFPGHGPDESLVTISWDAFFEKFEHEQLAFLYQEKLHSGEISRFHRFIQRRERGKQRAARRRAGDLDAAQQTLYRVMQIEEEAASRVCDSQEKARQIVDDANKKAEETVQTARSSAQEQAGKIRQDTESATADEVEKLLQQAESDIGRMQSAADDHMEQAVRLLVDWVIASQGEHG